MNRTTAEGVLARATRGQRVIVMAHRPRDTMNLILSCMTPGEERVSRVRTTSGREEIALGPGGRITFARSVNALRGQSADAVYLDGGHSSVLVEYAECVVASSPHGEVIHG